MKTRQSIIRVLHVLLFLGTFLASAAVPAQFQDGDLVPDGVLNAADLLAMTRIVEGVVTPTPDDLQHGDLYPPGTGDGVINISDLLQLLNHVQATPPVAVDDPDAAFTPADTTVTTANVLANDILANNARITAFDSTSANSTATNVVYNNNGTFDYTPPAGFGGPDTFTYTLTDDLAQTSTATVTVRVNSLPVANPDSFTVAENETLSGNVMLDNGNGADNPGDTPTTVAQGSINVSNGSLTLNTDGSFTYTPNPNFSGSDSFSYTLTDSTPDTSNEATVTITVVPNQSVMTAQTPVQADVTDGSSYELGMKFQSSTDGYIKAIRFYKAASETGVHTGNIWSATGTLLASVTFTGETASGWQEQALDAPLHILANTVYLVSVNANQYYALTNSGLETSISNGDLSSVADGNNGVFGTPGTFPTSSYQNTNYFRDVVFYGGSLMVKAGGDGQSGDVSAPLPTPLAVWIRDHNGAPLAGVPVDFTVTTGDASVSPANVVTDSNGQAATTLTLGSTAGTTTVLATATNVGSVTFTANGYLPATQLVLTPATSTTDISSPVSYQVTVEDQLGNTVAHSTNQITLSVSGIAGSFSPAATLTPVDGVATVSFAPGSTGTATIDASSPGLSGASATLNVTNTSLITTQVPANTNASDGVAYELGMKFQSSVAGHILAIRYYKSPSEPTIHSEDPGNALHKGHIWDATGTLLATAGFGNEVTAGWQEQALDTPLSIQPGTTYTVSVNSTQYFAVTNGGLATAIINGALSSVADGNNGVFGPTGAYPTSSYQDSNYFRDVVFTTGDIIEKTGGDNQSGDITTALPNPLVVAVRDANDSPVAGIPVTFSVTAGGGSVSPASAVTDSNGQASTTLTLGSSAGANTVVASAPNLGSVTFGETATVPPEPPTRLTLAPASAKINVSRAVTYHATLLDQYGNTVTTATNPVTFSVNGVSGSFSPSATVNPVNGIATVTFTPSTAGPATIDANSSGLTGASASLTVTDLHISIVSGDNQSGLVGTALPSPLVVQVTDSYTGQPVAGIAATFTISAGDGMLYMQSAATDPNGQASSRFILGATAGTNSVNVATTDAGSAVFNATGTSNGNTITVLSGNNQSGIPSSTLANPLVVEVRDSNNNPLSGVTVTFNQLQGTGSFSPTSVTNFQGQASTNFTLGSETGTRIINATTGVTGGATFTEYTANPVVIENLKTGDPDYQTVRIAYTDTDIVGYSGTPSVPVGGSLPLKISMATPGNYSIDVYRFGYYGGAGARKVMPTIGPLSGIKQPDCQVTDPQTHLIECLWSTSYTLAIGGDWTSGLYMARLWDEATGKQYPIFFTVRDDSSTSDIVFVSSINTDLAYSNYGTPTEKHSLYEFNSTNGQRAYKVSFDRPSEELSEYTNHLRYEYNMIRWLESQGYDVTYVTDLDVHQNPALLKQHKAVVVAGHSEYWSLEMRDGFEAARDAGVNLAFFAANTAYWRVRFEPSSTGQPDRVMVCYKDPLLNDPVAPTYLWRGPENNRPENALMGVMYTGDYGDQYGGFNYVVSQASDPYFNNTGLANNDALSGLVGYEWDAVVDNGFTPPGLVILSTSPVAPSSIAPGLPPGTDTTVSHSVRYTAPSGAKVFSTGSIQWVWGLDSDWVSPVREDSRLKQFTVNLFADFSVLPTTPSSGIIVP
jgi:5-hydroxyisourate hydrolase-like protein (transthyretin family)